MARIRTIKPSFFMNEDLGELSPFHRLLFAGLWCLADRDGRLEDRPKRIKIEILPWDDVDVDAFLDHLAEAGMIRRYEAEGQRVIVILNFKKHQRITGKEAETPSTLPAPPDFDDSGNNREALGKQSRSQEGKGRERKGGGRDQEGNGETCAAFAASVPPKAQPFEADFEEVWKTYPKKTDKAAAKRAYVARRRAGTPSEVLGKGVENYAAFLRLSGTDPKYIKNGSTFFGPDKPYEEWQEPRQPQRPSGSQISAVEKTMQVGMSWLAKYGEGDE